MKINELYTGILLKAGEMHALLGVPQKKLTKKNEPYFEIPLSDSTGTLVAKLWASEFNSKKELVSLLEKRIVEAATEKELTPIVLSVAGLVEEYNGQLQLKSPNLTEIEVDDNVLSEFFYLPVSDGQRGELLDKIHYYISTISNPDVREIITTVFKDEVVKSTFFDYPAACGHHHNYKYGLLLHTVQVLEYAVRIYETYPDRNKLIMDRDLIIMAALFHDLGKIEEYNFSSKTNSISYSDYEPSHRQSSMCIVREILAENGMRNKFPELMAKLGRVIYDHHGPYEGDQKVFDRETVFEAVCIHLADMASSKFEKAIEDAKGSL